MIHQDLFDWSTDYHVDVNLARVMPLKLDEEVKDEEGEVVPQGSDTCSRANALLVIADGCTLVDKLRADGIIEGPIIGPYEIPDKQAYFSFLNQNSHNDGVYVCDGDNRRMWRVPELGNSFPSLKHKFNGEFPYHLVAPDDFIDPKGGFDATRLGTKTRLFFKIPHAYEGVHTYIVKKSRYGRTELGPVLHATNQGLVESMFFDPTEEGVSSVHRKYEQIGLGVVKKEEYSVKIPVCEMACA